MKGPTTARHGALLVLAASASGPGLAWAALPLLHSPASFPDLLAAGCAVVGIVTWCWWAAGIVVCWWSVGRGVTPPTWTPRLARVLVAATLGAALPAVQARADTTELLRGLPLPDRAVAAADHDPASRRGPATGVVVEPGDCLWTLARQRLGEAPTALQVDRAWRELYRVNRTRVGPDPDLLRPGTRLFLTRSLASPPPGDLR